MPQQENNFFFEIKPQSTFRLNLKELAGYAELFYFFTWRDVKVKYKQTALGFLWAVLQPVLMMAIFTLLGRKLNVPSDGMQYSMFVYSGLVLWMIFSSGLTNAGNSMVVNAQIIKKIYFPRLIIPVSAVLVAVVDFIMAFLIFIILIFYFGQSVDWLAALMYWPLALLLTVMGTLGPGCLLAALNVKYRDFRYVIPFLVQALLFLTPVIYPVSLLQDSWMRYVLSLNPMLAALQLFRLPMSSAAIDPVTLSISIGSCAFFLVAGILYFRRTEMYFADLA